MALAKIITGGPPEDKHRRFYKQTGASEWTLERDALQAELAELQVEGSSLPRIKADLPEGCHRQDGKVIVPRSKVDDPQVREPLRSGRAFVQQDGGEV
jgi:hypothetical protein